MAFTRYAKNCGWVGIGRQAVKGTAVVPEIYLRATDETSLSPTMETDQENELGDCIYPGTTVKTLQKLDGSLNINARPDAMAVLLSGMLGDDTITGTDPYVHTIVPNEDISAIPWFTVMRGLADDTVQEETTDVRLTEMVIEGESGGRVTASLTFLGLSQEENSDSITPVYETDVYFMFYHGTFALAGSAVTDDILSFSLTIRAVTDEGDQTGAVILQDAQVVRYEVEGTVSLKVDPANVSLYSSVYYDTGVPAEELFKGILDIDLSYGTGATERGLKLTAHQFVFTEMPVEVDAGSDESLDFEATGHCEKHASNGLLTAVVTTTNISD